MNKPQPNPSNLYLAPAHLNHIRASINWQSLFEGLGLRKCEKRSNPDDWWAFSPFSDEKTPSFHISRGGLWYDFSRGTGGGPIELVQQIYDMNCYEAANLILENGWANSPVLIQTQERKTRDRVDQASTQYQNQPIRQDLLPMCTYHEYLAQRGISEETCEALGIGYLSCGRSPLRGRVVFQIRDCRLSHKDGPVEQVILSHMGRSISAEQTPKYLFYEGFKKSAELYGQELVSSDTQCGKQMLETGYIVVTEGVFDVARAYEAGIRNIVGCFGSRLSRAQADKLRNLCLRNSIDHVRICFDRDPAGRKGAKKAEQSLSSLGIKVSSFDWNAPLSDGPSRAKIPNSFTDIGGMNTQQIDWLRKRRKL